MDMPRKPVIVDRYEDETLLDGMAVRMRFSPPGGPLKSAMWLTRRRRDPTFPPCRYVGQYPHFRLGELRRWEDGLPTVPPPAQVANGVAGPGLMKAARERKKAEAALSTPVDKPAGRKPRPIKPPVAAE
jgi:hypothetical protein